MQISTKINASPKGGLFSDTIVSPKNAAQVLAIVTRSGKTLGDHLKEDLGEKMPKVKSKTVPPQFQEEDVKELMEVDEKVVENKKLQNDVMAIIQVHPPFPQRLHRKEKAYEEVDVKEEAHQSDTIEVTHGFSAIMTSKITEKKDDPIDFTIPCTIRTHMFAKALYDLGVSINLMPFVIYKNIRLDSSSPISMRLLMANRSIKRPIRILFHVLVKVNKFILPADFIVLYCEMDQEVPIILGQPFLSTGRAIIDLDFGEMRFRVYDDEVFFRVCKTKKQPVELQVIFVIDIEIEEIN
ncbi:uncharacterized protein LOC107841459 [Capsicum annuum]|uniref:uncharacterized protein LOC107841459 n=1 Tax=Capsicum annuum TaxID=4072 RepID=UPI001FB10DF1|nr:uncharacterized protein LOC107841459 [Capsicum annuum]